MLIKVIHVYEIHALAEIGSRQKLTLIFPSWDRLNRKATVAILYASSMGVSAMRFAATLSREVDVSQSTLQSEDKLFKEHATFTDECTDWNQTEPYWGTKRGKCGGMFINPPYVPS